MQPVILNIDEKDCLQELMNVAYGTASGTIADLLNAFVTLAVPVIKIMEIKHLRPYFDSHFGRHNDYYIVTQLLAGDFNGENLFVIDKKSTVNLIEIFDAEASDEDEILDVLLEITNILSSVTMSTLSELMKSSVSFSPPYVRLLLEGDQIDDELLEAYEYVIIISTELNFEAQSIKGQMIMLMTDESIGFIKEALNRILDSY